jgi:hypothetical protein
MTDNGGYLGVKASLGKLRQRCYFAGNGKGATSRDGTDIYADRSKEQGTEVPSGHLSRKWQDLSIRATEEIMHRFIKNPEVYAFPKQKTPTLAEDLATNFVRCFGVQTEVQRSQGRSFESSLMQDVMQHLEAGTIHYTRSRTT